MAELTEIRETVRERYAAAARAATDATEETGCCGPGAVSCSPADDGGVFGGTLYDEARPRRSARGGRERVARLRRAYGRRRPQ